MVTVGYNASTGKVLICDSGKVSEGCCVEYVTCFGCETPTIINAELSGITVCPSACTTVAACGPFLTGDYSFSLPSVPFLSASLENTRSLPSLCLWESVYEYDPGDSITVGTKYSSSDGSCTGTATSLYAGTWSISLSWNAGSVSLTGKFTSTSLGGFSIVLFSANIAPSDCGDIFTTYTDAGTSSDCGVYCTGSAPNHGIVAIHGYGGTGIIS
jgi:hypothetical protein